VRTPFGTRPTTRWTVRLRLTLLYGGLVLGTGVLLLGVTYVLMNHVLPVVQVKPPARPDLRGAITPPAQPIPDLQNKPEQQRAEDMRQFLTASALALVLMTFMSAGLGWAVAGRVLRPLRMIIKTARGITARNLHQRLDARGPDDEIKDLADTIDGLLDRLQSAFEAQRAFVANASHELRTPLTFERSLLEITLADPGASAQDLRAVCERLLAGNQSQERVIEALLTLARSQRGLDQLHDLDVAKAVTTALNSAREQVAARGLRLETQLDVACTSGDSTLVERLAANLLDNAVRHNTSRGGWVRIRTGVDAGRPTLCVSNSGPTIPADQVDSLFEPFRRLATVRTGQEDGSGLGLSIVAAIAAAHNARLDARALPEGGLRVRISFQPA
jgi:signal transduction histidine kinase